MPPAPRRTLRGASPGASSGAAGIRPAGARARAGAPANGRCLGTALQELARSLLRRDAPFGVEVLADLRTLRL